MPVQPGRVRRWLRPPRHLLLLLAIITAGSAAAFCWLGWEMLRQDEAAEAQRRQERLDLAAGGTVQTFTRLLGQIDDDLQRLTETRAGLAVAPPERGVILTFTATALTLAPATRLLFHPFIPTRSEPDAAIFADARTAEYGGEPRRAADLYRALARSPDQDVRAAAVMHLARVLRSSGRAVEALDVYAEMSRMGEAPVIGLPAELVARRARAEVLAQLRRPAEAAREAGTLLTDLAQGRWALTWGQYADHIEALGRLGPEVAPAAHDLALALAVSDLWSAWRTNGPPRGRKVVRHAGLPLLVMWRGSRESAAAWVVSPASLMETLAVDRGSTLALSDAEGFLAGAADRPAEERVRTAAETGLPWNVHVGHDGSSLEPAGFSRAHLIIAGMVVMLAFLGGGSYFIGRAVRHEMALAQQQADFVAAVSHEFRTPLAAMRQLSELLAAGRVPAETRRQQYYESLAGESRRLQRLVENLLNVGRLEAGARPYQLEPLDPRALVETVVAEFQSQLARPDCRIEVAGADDQTRLMADREAVALALHNLIDNAVKYSGPGHTVRVEWGRQDDRVALRVRDDGPGIAADERDRIFQKFVRGAAAAAANVRGTGVGLAMVQLVVAGHGGEVVVDSQPGAGATFTMLFPSTGMERPSAPPSGNTLS